MFAYQAFFVRFNMSTEEVEIARHFIDDLRVIVGLVQ
jgi:hypothetical protein